MTKCQWSGGRVAMWSRDRELDREEVGEGRARVRVGRALPSNYGLALLLLTQVHIATQSILDALLAALVAAVAWVCGPIWSRRPRRLGLVVGLTGP